MAKLGKKQQEKYHKLLKNQGQEVAQQYDAWIQAGKPDGAFNPNISVTPNAPAGIPPTVDLNNPQSVINYQAQLNNNAVNASTPNLVNDAGNRTVERDPVTGKITVNDSLTGTNKELFNQGQGNQALINSTFNDQITSAKDQAPYDPRKGQIEQIPLSLEQGSFRDMQGKVYSNALADYTASTREDLGYRREQLEQQMANEGIPRESVKYQKAMAQFEKTANEGINAAIRNAYRDSMDVGSQAFQNQLGGQAQTFGQQGSINDRTERMNQSKYMMPHQIAGQYMGAQGRHQDPNFGGVQSINAPQTDVFGYGVSYLNNQAQNKQFQQGLNQDWNIAKLNAETSRANAGVSNSGNSLTDRLALINAQAQAERDNFAYQQGFGGAPPAGTSYGDVAGSAFGGFVGGVANGMLGYPKRR